MSSESEIPEALDPKAAIEKLREWRAMAEANLKFFALGILQRDDWEADFHLDLCNFLQDLQLCAAPCPDPAARRG